MVIRGRREICGGKERGERAPAGVAGEIRTSFRCLKTAPVIVVTVTEIYLGLMSLHATATIFHLSVFLVVADDGGSFSQSGIYGRP